MRTALGISYAGTAYQGWQSQLSGQTVQDHLEIALTRFAGLELQPERISTVCAGRTDAGVHGIGQVVHFDTHIVRDPFSWVRGTNRYLPPDVAVQWAVPVSNAFHARASAKSRRYCYIVLESAVRPSLESGRVGWVFQSLDQEAMQAAAQHLLGEHDFSSFRASICQAPSPIKTLHKIGIAKRGAYWRFDFEANAFLHHMIRNIMGCLIAVGQGHKHADWMAQVLAAKSRLAAAPTFSPDGLYFVGPVYEAHWGLPDQATHTDWLP